MNYLTNYFDKWTQPLFGFIPWQIAASILLILVVWSFIWKGLALWKAGRRGDKLWFVILFLVNTVGILEILYIYVFSKNKGEEKPPLQ